MLNSVIVGNVERATSYIVRIVVSNLQAEKDVVTQLLSAKIMEAWKIGYANDTNASELQQASVAEEASLYSGIVPRRATQVFYITS